MISGSLGLIWKVVEHAPRSRASVVQKAEAMPIIREAVVQPGRTGVAVVHMFKTRRRVTVVLLPFSLSHPS